MLSSRPHAALRHRTLTGWSVGLQMCEAAWMCALTHLSSAGWCDGTCLTVEGSAKTCSGHLVCTLLLMNAFVHLRC